MQISTEAFGRICAAAKEISDIAGRHVECMGYLLAEKGSEAITGFYFPEQHGDDAESGTGDFLYRQFYEDGMHMTGMWHSHGSFPVFHSPIDFNHIQNRLKAMQRENSVLDAWDAYSNPGCIELFNRQTMQGIKIGLSSQYKPQIKSVHELLPGDFLSIVINRDTYNGQGKTYDAMQFWLENNEMKKEKASIEITPLMPEKSLEEMANKYTTGGLLLKESPAYKKRLHKSEIKGNAVKLTSKYGCFSIECDAPEQLAGAIANLEALPDEELNRYKEKLPRKKNAGESIESIVDEKPLLSLRQHEFSWPCAEAMEAHAFYVRLFLSAMGFYQRSESCRRYMHADKAVIDLFAALSGAVGGGNEKVIDCLSIIETSGAPLDVYINALEEAGKIIEKKGLPEKRPLLKKIKSMLKKAKGGKHA